MSYVTVCLCILLFFCVNLCPCEELSENQQKVLDAHNKYREIHNAPEMKINTEMSAEAAEWAEHLASTGTSVHSDRDDRNGDGESIYYSCGPYDPDPVGDGVKEWYREVCNYDFVAHQANRGGTTSDFTQMVWKKSVELGVGVATSTKDGMKCTYLVARYRPAGNWYGEYPENVLKGTFDESFCNNPVQDDKASSGSSSGRGGGIRRGNRWRHVLGNGSGKGSGSGASG